ncbi:sulfotransferase [Maritimibacter sp. 55A14]|uniref:sulfotransferase domain-containing protein n=1 Tax=Maritimibacter sp. 55A14 TaxID=2174844 RepID=UPI000D60D64C|nr:sulfotransferase domain-containing protein [Maritimibacter sp. 55A14]PWE32930.1 sulfotransferase [Maritimibacter sp. 55A14]
MGRLPDFLIIGAARSGTTAVYSYLRQNPSIFMPRAKEPNFFAYEGEALDYKGPGADYINNSITRLDAYKALFAGAPEGAVSGEASPLYLYAPRAPERIHAHVPQVRMVAILRNPIDQALSHFHYALKQRIEPIDDFTAALQAEDKRLADGWQPLFGYSRFPRYAAQLERYFKLFDRDQILVRTYEDLQTAPGDLIDEITGFIGADTSFRPDMSYQPNAGGVPRSKFFQDFLMKPNPVTGLIAKVMPQEMRLKIRDRLSGLNIRRDPAMPPEARQILRDRLLPEIDRLETLIERDLSVWKV